MIAANLWKAAMAWDEILPQPGEVVLAVNATATYSKSPLFAHAMTSKCQIPLSNLLLNSAPYNL
jgi:hypothetical protein